MKTRRLVRWAAVVGGLLTLAGCAEDPFDLGAPRSCEIGDQNAWVYGVMQELYLFNDEMPVVDPDDYATPGALVADLRVTPDRWSRVSDRVTSDALFNEGKFISFGFRTQTGPDGEVRIAAVYEGSPAGLAGMQRGDRLLAIGGQTIAEIEAADAWGGIYGENVPGVTIPFVVQTGTVSRDIVLTKAWVDIVIVPVHDVLQIGDTTIGYLFFQTFVDPAIEELNAAFEAFNAAGVTQVIVDVRYNGGGLISVSRHLTNLLVGGVAAGQVSYQIRYNDNFAGVDDARDVDRVQQSLPHVDAVAFVTTGRSLSASELLINSVRPHTRVEIIGDVTGGKPVGSKHLPFCDSVLAPITFELVNADNVGGYFDGLTPTCFADDDLDHALGDPDEASLAAAVAMLTGTPCPARAAPPAAPATRDDAPRLDAAPLELADWH